MVALLQRGRQVGLTSEAQRLNWDEAEAKPCISDKDKITGTGRQWSLGPIPTGVISMGPPSEAHGGAVISWPKAAKGTQGQSTHTSADLKAQQRPQLEWWG